MDEWMSKALAYIERENGDERRTYLRRVAPQLASLTYSLVETTTPAGVKFEMVKRSDGFTERWRGTWGPIVVSSESGFSVDFADVSFNVSGHEWDLFAEIAGEDMRL